MQEQLEASLTQCVCRQADLLMSRGRFEQFDLAKADAAQLEMIRQLVLDTFDVAMDCTKAEEALVEVMLAPLRAAANN